MIPTRFFRTPLHEHADPAQRLAGVAELPPDSPDLARLVTADPDAGVRAAAARRTASLPALAAAWNAETDPAAREAIEAALGPALANTGDEAAARSVLAAEHTSDRLRAEVARLTGAPGLRAAALAGIHDEDALVTVAASAGQAETRLAAAERVMSPAGLEKLLAAAGPKDRGVARLAKERLESLKDRAAQEAAADEILARLESLAADPGPVLMAVVDLNRRWKALDLAGDATRLARVDAARAALQARFEREQAEASARARLERDVRDWASQLAAPESAEALAAARERLADLRAQATALSDAPAHALLDEAAGRLDRWAAEREAVADAEALVIEAEKLAADTAIDDANLPARWQGLDRAIRTPALSRRFEAALIVVEQRRLAQVAVAEQEAGQARQKVHALLHAAEEALAAGQVGAAKTAAEGIRALKPEAGNLPKPTHQRISRVVQQIGDLEKWEAFGQRDARVRLAERAEALAAGTGEPARVAQEVKKLRDEWKALDQQHAGVSVPRSLWERFDGACEKAYAPAARHFAEQAAARKVSRKAREEFVAKATEEGAALVAVEPRDLRLMEQWLRDTEKNWREGGLGSVDPGAWKKLDEKYRAAIGPVRQALMESRGAGKAGREALIAEVTALLAEAQGRETPSKVKAIQLRWQAEAKAHPVGHRDERALWEKFRTACDAVFEARNAERKAADEKKGEGRRALEAIVARLEGLAKESEKSEGDLRRELREVEDAWRKSAGRPDPSMRGLENRLKSARTAVEGTLKAKARARESAVWQALLERERLCEGLDAKAIAGEAPEAEAAMDAWSHLAEVPKDWEKRLVARRDAALAAKADAHRARADKAAPVRARHLLELEAALGIDSPPEFQAERLQLQVNRLRERFASGGGAASLTPPDRLLAWCAEPGVAEGRDRDRIARILSRLGPVQDARG